jgi:hypothetical protein
MHATEWPVAFIGSRQYIINKLHVNMDIPGFLECAVFPSTYVIPGEHSGRAEWRLTGTKFDPHERR